MERRGIVWNIASENAQRWDEDSESYAEVADYEGRMQFLLDRVAELFASAYPGVPVRVVDGGFENQYASSSPRLDWDGFDSHNKQEAFWALGQAFEDLAIGELDARDRA